ncbi:hypothetical protein BKA61DRAFT_661511 [Leptodontidium sp. MPI-SDFR-AT-0119]|nr:hypothetical protein BKA61DRAFT_661511 [Leptodontidium sp. MPI-SDFR-AT-0119]
MDSTSHGQDASTVTERTQRCLSLMGKARKDEPANVIILLGETGAGKSLLLEYLTGTLGHSMEAADSVTKKFQIEKAGINGKNYYIMDTPGFDHGCESEVFHEVVKGIEAVRPHARIIGVLLITPMHHIRVNEMDEKLLRFARGVCGDEYMTQVTDVTTFWEAHKEKQKLAYNTRLANRLEKHGRKYEDGQDTGVFLEWDDDRDDIVEYAKDMIHRHYGSINPRDPQIVQELGTGLPLEHTAAGQSLGLTPASTHNSTSNPASSSSSTAPGPEEENAEKPKQDSPKQDNPKQDNPKQDNPKQEPPKQEPPKKDPPKDPPQSSSSSDGASEQGTGAQTYEKGLWDYGLEFLGTIVRNIHFDASAGSSGGFSGGPPGPSWPHIPMGPRYNGPIDRNSVVDIFKARGWDSSPQNRAQVGRQLGISGTPGTAPYNDALVREVEQFY